MRKKESPRKSQGSKSDGWSIVDILTVFGVMGLCAFLFLGFVYGGDSVGISLLFAVAFTFVIWLILFGLIKVKKVEKDFRMWRIVECVLLAVFLLTCGAAVPVLSNAINVIRAKSDLKEIADKDLNSLTQAIEAFKKQERQNLGQLVTNLKTIAKHGNYEEATTLELREYIAEHLFAGAMTPLTSNDEGRIKEFGKNWHERIDSIAQYPRFNSNAGKFDKKIEYCRGYVAEMGGLELPQVIEDVDSLYILIGSTLNDVAESYPLYNITWNEYSRTFDINIESNGYDMQPKESKVKKKFDNVIAETVTPVSGIFSLVIFTLIILNYLATNRSRKVQIKRGNSTGAQDQGHTL